MSVTKNQTEEKDAQDKTELCKTSVFVEGSGSSAHSVTIEDVY